jgi:hypothetical protein
MGYLYDISLTWVVVFSMLSQFLSIPLRPVALLLALVFFLYTQTSSNSQANRQAKT